MIRLTLATLALLPLLANACPPWARYGPPPPWAGYPPIGHVQVVDTKPEVAKDNAPDGWCHIKGRIIWDKAAGPIPVRMPIEATKDKDVAAMDGELLTEDWVVHPTNHGIRNIVVWLVPEPQGENAAALENARKENKSYKFPSFKEGDIYEGLRELPGSSVEIEIPHCRFIPHVVAVRAGQKLVISNTSPVPHNGKWSSQENGDMNTVIPPDKQQVSEKLKAERIPIQISCSIHPWMKCWVRVFDHPYFAVTDDNGKFEIKYVPKGNLRLFIWQETSGYHRSVAGRFGEKLEVPSGRLDLGEIKLQTKPPEKK